MTITFIDPKLAIVQQAAKKCIFSIAFNLMQNLEVAVNGLSHLRNDDSTIEEDEIDNFVQKKIMLYMVDSVELHLDRLASG